MRPSAIRWDGLLVTLDTVDNLRQQKYREVTITFAAEPPSLEGAGELEVIWRHENRIVFRVRGDVTDLLRALAASDITDARITEPSSKMSSSTTTAEKHAIVLSHSTSRRSRVALARFVRAFSP